MTFSRPRLFAALFLAVMLLARPAVSPGADNAAASPGTAGRDADPSGDEEFREPDFGGEPVPQVRVADPIEPFNRAMFVFNDKAYYWVLKPVAKGYNHVVNEDIRVSVRNFFSNLSTPVRVANHLLQGELRAAGTELARFAINSTTGILGLFDTARDNWGIRKRDTDLGLTLGKYGLGHGLYLVLPLLGPSSLRDGAGSFGDSFLEPLSYVDPDEASAGLKAYKEVNKLSLRIGQYEELTGAAVDPYVAVRDFYIQNRESAKRGRIRDNW
jgi:phospholipid-binding lipoprotein MlaA